MVKKKIIKYDWKITTKKFGVDILLVILAGILVVYQDNAAWVAIIPMIKALQNILKHYKK